VLITSTSPEQTFATTDDLSDPKILFDPATGRWYASILDLTRHSILIGVSHGGDPSPGQWSTLEIPNSGCPDQPRIGYSDALLVVSSDTFDSCADSGVELGSQLWVFDKASLLSGQNTVPAFSHGPDRGLGLQPAANTKAAAYLVETDGKRLLIARVTSTSPSSLSFATVPLRSTFTDPPTAVQPGAQIDSGDSREIAVAWQNDTLFFSVGGACVPKGSQAEQACAEYGAVSASGSLLWQSELSRPGGDFLYPVIQPDGHGSLLSVVGFTSATTPPQLLAVSLDQTGAFSAPVVLATSGASYAGSRWGDYFGMAPDPSNPAVVWAAGEVGPASPAQPHLWQTNVSALTVVSPPPPTPPHVRALGSSGPSRGTVALRFQVWDDSGKAHEHLVVTRRERSVFSLDVPIGAAVQGKTRAVAWHPHGLPAGVYKFCISASNASGLSSATSCAQVRVTA
jgi:hypothetical protein